MKGRVPHVSEIQMYLLAKAPQVVAARERIKCLSFSGEATFTFFPPSCQ